MTKIKTYKGFEIRFDTFDNKFYILYENEKIAKDKIENLEKSIDNILKAKFTKIPILVKVGGFENNGVTDFLSGEITSINLSTGKVFYNILKGGRKIKKQNNITWTTLFKYTPENIKKVNLYRTYIAKIRELEILCRELQEDMETVDIDAAGQKGEI